MVTLVCLHGFWGQPADFDDLLERVSPSRSFVPDLYAHGPLDPSHSFEEWTKNFCAQVEGRFGPARPILVGYSMGGRLALHAIAARPELFSRAILLSTNPGHLSQRERDERNIWERAWRTKFLASEWYELQKEWDEQEVFGGSLQPNRRRPDRTLLADSLSRWSVLKHKSDFQNLNAPLDWVFGGTDRKFLKISKMGLPGGTHVIENAGHRLTLDAPDKIAQLVSQERKPICQPNL